MYPNIYHESIMDVIGRLASIPLSHISDAIMTEGRPLRYPYTTGAMLMQFPYKFHFNKAWVYR